MSIAQSYASLLYPLSNEVKRDIAKLLMASIPIQGQTPTETAEAKFNRLYGCWADEPSMKNIEEDLREARTSGRTRKITPLDR